MVDLLYGHILNPPLKQVTLICMSLDNLDTGQRRTVYMEGDQFVLWIPARRVSPVTALVFGSSRRHFLRRKTHG